MDVWYNELYSHHLLSLFPMQETYQGGVKSSCRYVITTRIVFGPIRKHVSVFYMCMAISSNTVCGFQGITVAVNYFGSMPVIF